jgi:hypothetical protein
MSYGVEADIDKIISGYLEKWGEYQEAPPGEPWTEYDPIKAMTEDMRFEILLKLEPIFEKAWMYDDLCD